MKRFIKLLKINWLTKKVKNWYNKIIIKFKKSSKKYKYVIYKNKCLGKIKNVKRTEYIIYDNNILLITSVNDEWVNVQLVSEGAIIKCAIFHNL